MSEFLILTEEEKNLIEKHRANKAKREVMRNHFSEIQRLLREIEKMGGSITMPTIGGKYIPIHTPKVTAEQIDLYY
jgi:hypothetical protein